MGIVIFIQSCQFVTIDKIQGEVQEWFNWQSWKDCVRATAPRVRIPPSPPS